MITLFTILSWFSAVCFLFYGMNCIISKRMTLEFERFGIPHYRVLTGILQLIGGTTLLIGIYGIPILSFIGSAGLALLMFLGFAVRLKIKDSFMLSAPSLLFGLLNLFLAYKYYFLL